MAVQPGRPRSKLSSKSSAPGAANAVPAASQLSERFNCHRRRKAVEVMTDRIGSRGWRTDKNWITVTVMHRSIGEKVSLRLFVVILWLSSCPWVAGAVYERWIATRPQGDGTGVGRANAMGFSTRRIQAVLSDASIE